MHRKQISLACLLMCVLAGYSHAGLHAQTQSLTKAISDAVTLMGQADYSAAETRLKDALRKAPRRAELHLLLAQCENRRLNYASAHGRLMMLMTTGVNTPALFRELGIAALGQGHTSEALTWMLKTDPNDPVARFVRARTYMAREDWDQALSELDAAIGLDDSLAPQARLFKADILTRRGKIEAAREEIASGQRHAAGTPLQQTYANADTRLNQSTSKRSRFRGSATLGIQYNTNVMLRPDNIPLGAGVDGEEDPSFYASMRLDYTLYQGNKTVVGVGGGYHVTLHPDLDDFNMTSVQAELYAHRKMGPWRFHASGGGGYSALGGNSLATYAKLGGGAVWEIDKRLIFQSAYSARLLESHIAPAVQHETRDGWYHDLSGGPSLTLFDKRVGLAIKGLLGLGKARGSSAVYASYGAQGQVQWRFLDNWSTKLGAKYVRYDYRNPNIRNGFAFEREDDQLTFFAGLAWRMTQDITLALDVQHIDNQSNIPGAFEYDRMIVGGSATYAW